MADPIIGFNEGDARQLLNLLNGDAPLIAREEQRVPYVRHYKFTMTGDFVNGIASATITQLSGEPVATGAELRPGMSAFEELTNGDSGMCFRQDGYYWISNANCPA